MVQALRIHEAHPSTDLPTGLTQMELERTVLIEATCPAIQSQYDALSNVAFSVVGRHKRSTTEHIFRLHVSSMSGTFQAIATDAIHQLIQWAVATLKALKTCAARQQPQQQPDGQGPSSEVPSRGLPRLGKSRMRGATVCFNDLPCDRQHGTGLRTYEMSTVGCSLVHFSEARW
jgi:hypothetical protein